MPENNDGGMNGCGWLIAIGICLLLLWVAAPLFMGLVSCVFGVFEGLGWIGLILGIIFVVVIASAALK